MSRRNPLERHGAGIKRNQRSEPSGCTRKKTQSRVFGFDRTEFPRYEEENAELLCYVCSSRAADLPSTIPGKILERFSELPVAGKPNRLSRAPFNWKRIYRTAELARRGDPDEKAAFPGSLPFRDTDRSPFSAAQIIRRRRSALDFRVFRVFRGFT
ncbi:MAG: hypothetical protein C4530_07180 [Desulfobacteraceae bacterium]|nr:MAG: hypothetical protein C4530_07180 [Desulfobacteraceae bacterium]